MNVDDRDKAMADLYEANVKDISINGVEGFAEPIMTAEQYAPTTFPDVAATMPRDNNRGMGLAMLNLLRLYPLRLATIGKAFLPAAADWAGCLVFVPDAAGSSIVAFSDGSNWRRMDTGATVT